MEDMSSYTEGQVHQLVEAFEKKGGLTSDHLTKLGQSDLSLLRGWLDGLSEIKPIECAIDCGADPFVPNGWKVESHQKDGIIRWSLQDTVLYLSKKQKDGGVISGYDLQKELAAKKVLNANVLDYLLAHQHLIPESWKGKAVFFWGTIYRDASGNLYVRYLYWIGVRGVWHCHWLGSGFGSNFPSALRGK